MPIGGRTIGTATGPRIAPRLVDVGGNIDIASSQADQAVANASGIATLTFRPEQQGTTYLELERVIVKTNSAGTPVARVYVGTVADTNEVDFTTAGKEDVADQATPVHVPGGTPLIVQWTGCAAGDVCTARIHYRLRS